MLDVGCGNGRNSIHLANHGCSVDCFDVIDLGWREGLPDILKNNIHFEKSNIFDYPYLKQKYKAIVLARVIQYLDDEELKFLLNKITTGLTAGGFLLLSYSIQGGIFNRREIDVPKHVHSIQKIESLLKSMFKNVFIAEGNKKNLHVNYVDDIFTYDIYAYFPIYKKDIHSLPL